MIIGPARLLVRIAILLALALPGWSVATDAVLKPVADTYLKATTASTAYGAVTTIEANNAGGLRVMLLRFDLSGLTQPVTRLRCELTATAGTAGNSFQVYGLKSGEGWVENTVTWATAPGVNRSFTGTAGVLSDYLNTAELTSSLGTFTSAVSGAVTVFDVTSGPIFDFIAADADKVVTFLIAEADPSDTGGDRFQAREATTGQPSLTVSDGTVTPPPPVVTTTSLLRVILVGGQSNADGRAPGSGLPATLQQPQTNVPFYYYTTGAATNSDGTLGTLTTLRPGATQTPSGGFGPEVMLGAALSPLVEQQAGTGLAIIKYAKGGSSLYADWKPSGDATTTGDGPQYQTFQQVVRNGLAKLRAANPSATVQLAGMIWVQGETDIDGGSSRVSVYGSNLTSFIADVRKTFGATLPFCLSRISAQQTVYSAPSDPDYQNYLTIRAQQEQVAANVPNTYLIDADSTDFAMNSDKLHFNAAGQQAMGLAFARQLSDVILLRFRAFEPAASGGLRLQWNGLSGRQYIVQRSSDLLNWTGINVGVTSEWTDPAPVAPVFYRVQEVVDSPAAPLAKAAASAAKTSRVALPQPRSRR